MAGRNPPFRRFFTPPRQLIFRRALARALRGCRSVLDVGCGGESPIAHVGYRGWAVGVDLSRDALLDARGTGAHAALVRADASVLARVFRPRSVDATVALDVVEHLERDAAHALLADLEQIARRRVIVFTPNGFVPQPPQPGNPHQEHRCGFTADDLRARGYRVRGIHGLWCVSGPFGDVRWLPGVLWRRVADLTAPLVYPIPRLAFALLAIKDLTPASGRGRRA
jgi:SAM-dependent methyltransferase